MILAVDVDYPGTGGVAAGVLLREFVTAAGMTSDEAKRRVLSMAGKYRLPDMLKHVDGVARRGV
ncbi:MAG TPA: hypothetical protein VF555_24410 [Variovorax sp.]